MTMKRAKTASLSALLIGALAAGGAPETAAAGEGRVVGVLEPAKGMSFDIGSKRAVGYFLSTGNGCRLTLLLTQALNSDEPDGSPASRVQLVIDPGRTARIDTADGQALEFSCTSGARKMSVEALEQVAWAPAK